MHLTKKSQTGRFMQNRIIWAALAALSVVTPAAAQECNKPLKLLAALPMTKWQGSDLVTVPVSINDTEKQFLLSTGGDYTQMTRAVADEFKMPVHKSKAGITAKDGTRSYDQVTAPKFAIGPAHMENSEIPVAPTP